MAPPAALRPPTISVVITACARPEPLQACLRAVRNQTSPPVEVIVVESGRAGAAIARIAVEAGATYLHEPQGGESRARNLGARNAAGQVVAFTDDDALPEPEWLAALASAFVDPRVSAAAGCVIPAAGSGEAKRIAVWLGLSGTGGERPRRLTAHDAQWFDIANFGGLGIGPNMAFRRTLFDTWTGFDPHLGTGTALRGGAEPYAFFSVLKQGHTVAYTPFARVAHPNPLPPLGVLRERQRHAFAAAAGYVVFLILAEPQHRWVALRYAVEGLAGRRRTWRDRPEVHSPVPLPRRVRWAAYLRGVRIGLSTWRAARRSRLTKAG
jgi:glycosyltransferase involved in cell wall biosynthesis